MPKLFETERLIINAPQMSDLKDCINLYMNPGLRSLMFTKAKDEAQIKEWLEESIRQQAEFGFSDGTVIEKSTGKFIGRAGLTPVGSFAESNSNDVEVNCYLLSDYWQQGYGLELLHACFEWGFKTHKLERILATVYSINIPARKLAEKSGMKFTGIKPYKNVDFMWYEISNK